MDPLVALRRQAARRALKAAGVVISSRGEMSANSPERTLVRMRRSSSAEALRTAPELLSAADNLENEARLLFQKYAVDKDGSKSIAREDFDKIRAVLAQRRDIGMFALADCNSSSSISWDDFACMWNAAVQYEATHETVHNEAARLTTAAKVAKDHLDSTESLESGVLGQKAFSAAYRLSRSVADHTLINMSNNHIGKGILNWLAQFDPTHSMQQLVARECSLKDAHIEKLAKALRKHPNIRKIDLRGNRIGNKGILALLQLVKINRNIVELQIDDGQLYGPSSQNLDRIRKETTMNRRSQGNLTKQNLLPPIKDTLYTAGNKAHPAVERAPPPNNGQSKVQRRFSDIMPGLFSAKVKSSNLWKTSVIEGKKRRGKELSLAKSIAKENQLVTNGMDDLSEEVDFREQGNLDMYSNAALLQRSGLRDHPEIKACCHRWWNCLIIPIIDKDHSGSLCRAEYIVFHKCLNLALMHDRAGHPNALAPLSSAEATRLALEDWEHDARGADSINAEQFELAMFELADLWTETTDVQEYVDLLDWLFSQMVTAMTKFPNLSESQRASLRFQKRRRRLLIDMKRAKTARMASIGVQHMFTTESLARLHRDFDRFSKLVQIDWNRTDSKSKVKLCSRLAFNNVMALQGYPSCALTSQLFDVFDIDHSGYISFEELIIGLSLMCSDSLEKLGELVFKIYDLSGSGRISRFNVKTVLSVSSKMCGNGLEMEGLEERLDEIFAGSMKSREDGFTLENFIRLLDSYPELVACVVDAEGRRILRKNLAMTQ